MEALFPANDDSQRKTPNDDTRLEMKDRLGNNTSKTNDDEDDFPPSNGFVSIKLRAIASSTESFVKGHSRLIRLLWIAVLNLAIFAYFFAALHYWINYETYSGWQWCDGFGLLLVIMSIVYFALVYFLIVKRIYGKALGKYVVRPVNILYGSLWKYLVFRVVFFVVLAAMTIGFLIWDTWEDPERLISLLGLVVLLLLGFIFSTSPDRIRWRPVVWGAALQFIFGLLTIRWAVGRAVFQCLGDKVGTFLNYAKAGSSFVFSDTLVNKYGVFAFSVLTVIFFFSMMVEMLYYLGAMQWMCLQLGWLLQVTCGTTVCESLISVANIFLGNTESPLMVKPYLKDLTPSELHVLMSSGFATVSGTVLAAYISFGAEPAHLITASVMSAPAAICYSKLVFPETRRSKTTIENIQIVESEDSTILGAAARGAVAAIPLVLNIVANLVAFISFVAFVNGLLGFFGGLLNFEQLSLEWIFGKVFIPLSWIMGVPWDECELVGTLIGIKTIINEFVAYQKMGEFKEAGLLSARGEAIATYALCGFTNLGAVATVIGAIGAMAPNQRETLTRIALRAFLSGAAICFMTACIAGLLITPGSFIATSPTTTTTLNSTLVF